MLNDPSQVGERFVIESRVGGGASGEVFKTLDHETGQHIALKLLRDGSTEAERSRFTRESEIIADLRHPNIVDYVAHGTWPDGRLFMAMEWLEGEDLAKRQRRAPLGTRDSVEVVRRAAQALAAIHSRGIVHRDLKLSNMFLVKGRGTAIKLIDFGVVRLPKSEDEFATETGTILGTPHYMAPEQARGEDVDARADVYSLGSVLFRLLTGRNVFETEHVIALLGRLVLEDPPHPGAFRFDIPEKLDAVVYTAISRDKDDRYDNAGDFARALARVGQLNNDPPQVERSASAVLPRRKYGTFTGTGTGTGSTGNQPTRPGLRIRRVVACLVYDFGDSEQEDERVASTLVDFAGEDVRIEHIASGKTVAVLGVEHSQGDEVMRAARAALQIVKEYPQVRVVVSNGHAVQARANLAGEALDRAARQLEKARAGTVRLDLHAAAAIEMRFEVQRDADGADLIREDPRDLAPRKLLGQPTPTVGREKEIAELQKLYTEVVRDSFPRAGLVMGSIGIGKSRIRSELTQRFELAPTPPEVLMCRGDAVEGGASISVLGKALRATMGVQDGAEQDEQIQRVKRFVRSRLPRSLHFLGAFIGELVGVPFPDQADEPLRAARANDQLMQSRIRMALEAYMRTQAGRIPQMLILEDAHLADDTTIELIDWLLACPDIRFCVFAFAQNDLNRRRPTMWEKARVTRITLGPLQDAMAERLIGTVLPDADDKLRANLIRRASGNPLVLEELVRCAAEGRSEMPLTVQALVQQRLDRLPPSVHEVVRAAAVFGPTFWAGGVEELLERPVEQDLEHAEREEIILRQTSSRVAGQTEFLFRQASVREAAHASLLEEDRQELHLATGQWLEHVGCVDLGLIARHIERGGHNERAASLYARATQQALGNFGQMETALELSQRGLDCGAEGPERAQLLLTQALVHYRMGRLADGIVVAEQAAKLSHSTNEMWVEAQRLLAACLIESGRAAEGDARLAWALGAGFASALSHESRAILMATRVRGLVDLNRPTEALSVSEAAVDAAQAAGQQGEVAMLRALDARLFALMSACLPAAAIDAGDALIEAADRAGDVHLACRGRINSASALNYLGAYEKAQERLDRAMPDVRSFRLRLLEGFCIHNLGMACARNGDLERGIQSQREAALIADECDAHRLSTTARIYESMMLGWRGEPGDFRRGYELAQHAMEASEKLLAQQVIALFALARMQLIRHEGNAALEAAREAHRRLDDGPVEEWDEHIRLCFVEALLATGNDDEADRVLGVAFEVMRQRTEEMRNSPYRASYVQNNNEVRQLLFLAEQRLNLTL
ncbi:MAG: protein kinase [Deltaproteobacteria bacterium]|nr:protein kinase [Deltaproteobacteria bacterium]